MKSNLRNVFCMFVVLLFCSLCGCSSHCRPQLYPNRYYNLVREKQANTDIDQTIEEAESQGLTEDSTRNKELGKSAAKKAANAGINSGISIAMGGFGIGSIISAALAGTSWIVECFFSKKTPDPMFKKFVENRLSEKGYQILGWQ